MLNINFVFMPIHLFSDIQLGILSTLFGTASKLTSAWAAQLAVYQIGMISMANDTLGDAVIPEIYKTLPFFQPTLSLQERIVERNKKFFEDTKDKWRNDLKVYNEEHENLFGRIERLLYQSQPHALYPGR